MEKVIDELVDDLVADFKESIVVLDKMEIKIDLHPYLCMFMSGVLLVLRRGNRPQEEIDYVKHQVPKRLKNNTPSEYDKIISKLKN